MSSDRNDSLQLSITEKWLRDRLNLQSDSLDGVRSLSLPGSYGEKISHVGRSLLGFTRLKHLDLSRNALESLSGFDHLKELETLNLYYNNISSLKELFKLRYNSKIKDLDLRLNPVTKNEPDYRLFIVHMLVNLRRLDDCSVRDSERRAALLHFDTDQANTFEWIKPWMQEKDSNHSQNHVVLRKQLVQSLASKATSLEDNTDELLELIAKSDSVNIPSKQHHHTPKMLIYKQHGRSHDRHAHHPHSDSSSDVDSNISSKFSGEAAAYKDLKVTGNFTPAPVACCDQPHVDGITTPMFSDALNELVKMIHEFVKWDLNFLQMDSNFRRKFDSWLHHQNHITTPALVNLPLNERGSTKEELQKQLETFQQTVQTKEVQVQQLQDELSQSKSEVCILGERLKAQESVRPQVNTGEEVHQLLQQANKDMEALQQHMQTVQEENSVLKRTIEQNSTEYNKLHRRICGLQIENQKLKMELSNISKRHKQDMINAGQIQELVVMLQESHHSLVETNDHLRQELEETKLRHSKELTQMNSNYERLKKTVAIM